MGFRIVDLKDNEHGTAHRDYGGGLYSALMDNGEVRYLMTGRGRFVLEEFFKTTEGSPE